MADPYEVAITPEGLPHLNRLPAKVREAALELILGPLAVEPRRIAKPLIAELDGLWSARRGDYRVVFEIDDRASTITVYRVQHRRDVYRRR